MMALENDSAVPSAASANIESEISNSQVTLIDAADHGTDNFGKNEIALLPPDAVASDLVCPLTGNPVPAFLLDATVCGNNLKQALARADASIDDSNSLFVKMKEKVKATAATAYPVGLYLFTLDRDARINFLRTECLRGYTRQPNVNNPWLLSLIRCTRAADDDQRNYCSTLAPLLAYAAMKSISPSDFADFMSNVTISTATAEVRAKKRASKKTIDDGEVGPRIVKFSVGFQDDSKAQRGTVPLDEQTHAALQARFEPPLEGAQWAQLLRALADAIQPPPT